MLLKARVEDDMPRLTAQLVPKTGKEDEPVVSFQGQVSSWTLRLSNIGTAPATDIALKTNLPWVKVDSTAARTQEGSTSHAVGPTGTLLALPIEGDNLRTPGQLQPGESIDLAVSLRTVGTTQQDFYMLYRYELVGGTKNHHLRWLKQMVDVAIYPSVALTASVMPSFWEKKEHILSVEVRSIACPCCC